MLFAMIQQIIERAKARDNEAIAYLYEKYAQPIYRYIRYRVFSPLDAEDLTAEVFIKMLEGLAKYQYTGAPFEAWLYRIAAARIIDFQRKQNRRPQAPLSDETLDSRPLPEEVLQDRQEFDSLQNALTQLPDEAQTVLLLRFIERKSHQEVADFMGKSVPAVKSIQYRALVQLTALLGSETNLQEQLGDKS